MSKELTDNNQIINIYKRDIFKYKKSLDKSSLSNITNYNSNNISNLCFAQTTKNSPRFMNISKLKNLRNKSFNLKHFTKKLLKSNLKIENFLDSTGDFKKLKVSKKNIDFNIETINMNLKIKKFPHKQSNNNDIYQHDLSSIKNKKFNNKIKFNNYQIYRILNNKNNFQKENINYSSNDNSSNSIDKNINNNCVSIVDKKHLKRINTGIYILNKNKEPLNKNKISPIIKRVKYFSIKKQNENNNYNNYEPKKKDRLFNSLKDNFIKKNSIKNQRLNNNYLNKIRLKKLEKNNNKNTTPKNNKEKLKINDKTKINEISFNNIPKIFQFNSYNNKKQTRNFNYHKKQPSLSLTKTSNKSQCNFTESNSLENMFNQITINKNQNNTSIYNNSITISNEKSSNYNNAISIYNILIKENTKLNNENNELKHNNIILYEKIKKLIYVISILKNIINNVISIYKNNFNNIINNYKKKENQMKNNLIKYTEYTKKLIDINKFYSINELNKDKKISKIIRQTLIENKILRNLYNNLLLFDPNNSRLYTSQSDTIYNENEIQDNIINDNHISGRSNKFLEENNSYINSNKRNETIERKKVNDIENIFNNIHHQSRNYNNKNELNMNINNNKQLQKYFIRKINYRKKK